MSYPYSETNRLEQPHSYMYTPFGGVEFIQGYLASRKSSQEFFSRLGRGTDNDAQILSLSLRVLKGEACKEGFLGSLRPLGDFSAEELVRTDELLSSLISAQLKDGQTTSVKIWLDRLAQRFEVTKKLSESYLPGFRKGEGSTEIVRLYWLLALALTLRYQQAKELKFLSTLLKVNDLLCSLPESRLEGRIPAREWTQVLNFELEFITALAKSQGVPNV